MAISEGAGPKNDSRLKKTIWFILKAAAGVIGLFALLQLYVYLFVPLRIG